MRVLLAALATGFMMMVIHVNAEAATLDTPSCRMQSEGIFDGAWVKHRIVVNEDVVYGANDLDSILSQLDSLRDQGLCR
ncbi:hypothetical protein EZJ49_00735 [Bdellovibrio bacteriovorus]|uniref:hypothetical protein n=1 Tax=Bdellovibrio bacteriovorus TaxID=959 RepID=UPI0021CE4032|nr:hypothetical protein [Bdellovibrio bacteriovorus]UXR64781.1 hypothetical protein EZJ49_00735 [Bdellovibrio bacteriovorus]